jgi:hypothetical protein
VCQPLETGVSFDFATYFTVFYGKYLKQKSMPNLCPKHAQFKSQKLQRSGLRGDMVTTKTPLLRTTKRVTLRN